MPRIPFVVLLLSATSVAQSVLPPFDANYQAVNLGLMPGVFNYGGTAFLPGNPNLLLVSPYASGAIRAVPLTRDPQGFITGFAPAFQVATVGGTDGGLAFGPNNVLFATWYGFNRLSQIVFGGMAPSRVDDLAPLGITYSVGACTFVPAGLPGAGRLKLCSWSAPQFFDVPLTPDGNGTFAPGTASAPITMPGDVEGLVYAPSSAALIGGQLLVCEWGPGNVVAYQVDAIGDPLPATRQVVIGGAPQIGGGAVDPITGDIVFAGLSGSLIILRSGSACGTFTSYGVASPGASGTPTISGAGCANIGQTVTLGLGGAPNAVGLLALGSVQLNVVWNGLTILQSLEVSVTSILSPTGTGSFGLPIPLNPSLGNQHFFLQTAYFDASTSSGLVASAGLNLLVR